MEWPSVFVRLHHPKDLCSIIQTCKQFQRLADSDAVWRAVAQQRWPSVALLGPYGSCKELVLDDNRQNLCCVLPLADCACLWRYRQPQRYYECRLLQLEWWRSDNSLRLYVDARGETDLRPPETSSLAVLQPATPCTAAAAAAPASANILPPSRSRLCLSCQPDAWHPVIAKPGHFKGVLVWQSFKCTQVLQALLGQLAVQQEQQQEQPQRPPAPQHSHRQCGRRSQAWEEWADWQLDQQEEEEWQAAEVGQGAAVAPAAAALPAAPPPPAAAAPPAGGVQGDCLAQFTALFRHAASSGRGSSRRSRGTSSTVDAAASAGTGSAACVATTTVAGSSSNSEPAAAAGGSVWVAPGSSSSSSGGGGGGCEAVSRLLVFCYANDLQQSFQLQQQSSFWWGWLPSSHYSADYTTALLAAATPDTSSLPQTSTAADAAAAPAAARAAHSSSGGRSLRSPRRHQHQHSTQQQQQQHLAALAEEQQQQVQPPGCSSNTLGRLASLQEGRWAEQWQRLPGAALRPLRQFEVQLQHEGPEERARWADLPAAVLQRGGGWWV